MIPEGGSAPTAPVTRGFLFADLRGYTAFTETHGDSAARKLLEKYRRLVREIVGHYGGAEIRTEGDSFYVIFPSATSAVGCGIAIVAAAHEATAADPALPINVGVGIHAGETADSDEGYVGSAVNVAARICALAQAGEVLVSDTVRGLTRTGGQVRYQPRGQRRLKGVAEPITVFSATAADRQVVSARTRVSPKAAWAIPLFAIAVVVLVVAVLAKTVGVPQTTPSPTPTTAAVITATAGPTARPTPTPHPTPTPTTAFLEMPFGDEPVPAAGRYSLTKFFMRPEIETDGGWQLGICRRKHPCVFDTNAGYDRDLAQLSRTDRPRSQLILFHPVELPVDPCADFPASTFGPADTYLDWMRSQPALLLGDPVARRFNEFNATQISLTVVDAEACQHTAGPHSVSMNTYGAGGEHTYFGLDTTQSVSVYVFTVQDGLFAFAVAPTADELDRLDPQVDDLLNSLHFPDQ